MKKNRGFLGLIPKEQTNFCDKMHHPLAILAENFFFRKITGPSFYNLVF
jgi:hypothetical protein